MSAGVHMHQHVRGRMCASCVCLSLSLSVSLLFAVCVSLMLSRVRTSMLGSTEWFLDCEILKSLNPELYTVFGLEIFPVKYDR